MVIRRRPELDTTHPPGQVVNPLPAAHMEKPLTKHIDDYVADTEELFAPCYNGCFYYTDSCFRSDCKRKDK